jgi:hypothetical protein
MKSIVSNVKNIIVRALNFGVKFAPVASVVVGVGGMAMGLVAAPVALTAIGGVVLVCSAIELVSKPSLKTILTVVIEGGIARFAGYAVLGKLTIWLVGLQLMVVGVLLGFTLRVITALATYIIGEKILSTIRNNSFMGERPARVGCVAV